MLILLKFLKSILKGKLQSTDSFTNELSNIFSVILKPMYSLFCKKLRVLLYYLKDHNIEILLCDAIQYLIVSEWHSALPGACSTQLTTRAEELTSALTSIWTTVH